MRFPTPKREILVVAFLAFTFLYSFSLFHLEEEFDFLGYKAAARSLLAEGSLGEDYGKAPLYPIIIAVFLNLGILEKGLHFLVSFGNLFMSVAVFFLAKEVFDEKVALLALYLFTLSGARYWIAAEGRLMMPWVATFYLFSILWLWKGLSGSRKSLLGFWVAAILANLAHFSTLSLLPTAVLIWYLKGRPPIWKNRWFSTGLALYLLLFSFWLYRNYRITGSITISPDYMGKAEESFGQDTELTISSKYLGLHELGKRFSFRLPYWAYNILQYLAYNIPLSFGVSYFLLVSSALGWGIPKKHCEGVKLLLIAALPHLTFVSFGNIRPQTRYLLPLSFLWVVPASYVEDKKWKIPFLVIHSLWAFLVMT